MYTYASAFAGIGGMTMGLEPLGFKGVMAWEYDPTAKSRQFAQDAHKLLHPHIPLRGDVTKINTYAAEIPNFDLLCFTPPCQPFSSAGNRRGLEDARGTVIYSVFELIQLKQPKILFMENVKGLLSNEDGETWQTMLKCFNDLGYVVDYTVLNSAEFHVPQKRERLYLVALRKDVADAQQVTRWNEVVGSGLEVQTKKKAQQWGINSFQFDWPQTSYNTQFKSLGDILDNTWQYTTKYDIPELREQAFLEGRTLSPQDVRAVALRYGHMYGRRVKNHGEPSFTLTATVVDGVCMYDEVSNRHRIRRLTGQEYLKLQAIPPRYIELLTSNFSESRLYKFAGNGLTINVVNAIGQHLLKYLEPVKVEPHTEALIPLT